MLREIHHVRHNCLEVHDFYAQIVFLVEIFQLVKTIVTWDNDHLRPGLSDLLGLDPARLHPSPLERWAHRDIATTAATAMIVRAVVCHIAEICTQLIHQIPCWFPKPAISGYVARILIGHRFCDSFGRIDLDAAVSHIIGEELYTVNNRNGGFTTG